MNEMKLFKTPYSRPLKLSDPHEDFPEEILSKIINTLDENMGKEDFQRIFQMGLPAGTYKECCYFLPYAIRYMTLNPDNGLDCESEIVYFISKNANNLSKDNILETCVEACNKCLSKWTERFIVVHLDKEACQKKNGA